MAAIRCCLVFINMLLILGALGGMVVGLLLLGRVVKADAFSVRHFDAPYAFTTVGKVLTMACAVLLLVSLPGCIGSCCIVRALMIMHCLLLFCLLGFECALIVFLSAEGHKYYSLRSYLLQTLDGYTEPTVARQNVSTNQTWSVLNVFFESSSFGTTETLFLSLNCCGVDSYSDFWSSIVWQHHSHWRYDIPVNESELIPVSCCRNFYDQRVYLDDPARTLTECFTNTSAWNAFVEGCYPVLRGILHRSEDSLIIIAVIAAFIQVLLLVMTAVQLIDENLTWVYEQEHISVRPTERNKQRAYLHLLEERAKNPKNLTNLFSLVLVPDLQVVLRDVRDPDQALIERIARMEAEAEREKSTAAAAGKKAPAKTKSHWKLGAGFRVQTGASGAQDNKP